jgi:hypothetical protein
MQSVRAPGGGELLVDHVNSHGSQVRQIRGILLVNAIANLREWGLYECYRERLPQDARYTLEAVIAASWVDVDVAITHYEASAHLGIDEARAADAGKRLGDRIAKTFMGMTLRTARGAGLDAFGFVLRRNHTMWDRMYQGGGTRLRQLAAKEMLLEDYGNPIFRFDLCRIGYYAYWDAIGRLCCRDFRITPDVSSRPDDGRLVTHFSWR